MNARHPSNKSVFFILRVIPMAKVIIEKGNMKALSITVLICCCLNSVGCATKSRNIVDNASGFKPHKERYQMSADAVSFFHRWYIEDLRTLVGRMEKYSGDSETQDEYLEKIGQIEECVRITLSETWKPFKAQLEPGDEVYLFERSEPEPQYGVLIWRDDISVAEYSW